MDIDRVLNVLAIALLCLAISGIAVYLGVQQRDRFVGLDYSIAIANYTRVWVSLKETDVGIVLQLCGPTTVEVVGPLGRIAVWNVSRSYWETVIHFDEPGVYLFIARGCGVLRIIQASGVNPRSGLVMHVLDPYERRALNTAAVLSIAASAGFLCTVLTKLFLERLRR